MNSLCHPRSAIVGIGMMTGASISLRLIVISNGCVQISLLPISCLGSASASTAQSSALVIPTGYRRYSSCSSCCIPDLRLAQVCISDLLLVDQGVRVLMMKMISTRCNNLIVIVVVDGHSLSSILLLHLMIVLANRCSRFHLLRRASSTASSHIVETLSFLHVFKIESVVRVRRPDLLDGLTVLLFQLF